MLLPRTSTLYTPRRLTANKAGRRDDDDGITPGRKRQRYFSRASSRRRDTFLIDWLLFSCDNLIIEHAYKKQNFILFFIKLILSRAYRKNILS